MRLAALAVSAAAVACLIPSARAADITDGSLVVDIENGGQFNVVTLNGIDIDITSFLQAQVTAGTFGFAGVTPVVAAGPLASYTASTGSFGVSATSRVLGPLASNPSTTNVLQQVFTFTNTSATAARLTSVSDIDPDLADDAGDDTVAYDAARGAVVSTDPTGRLMAAIANTTTPGATFGFDVDFLGAESFDFPMDNGVGPVGPGDTAMSLGYDFGLVPAGESRTVEFRYLFSTDLSAVPSDFVVPEPTTLAALAGLGMVALRRRK